MSFDNAFMGQIMLVFSLLRCLLLFCFVFIVDAIATALVCVYVLDIAFAAISAVWTVEAAKLPFNY